ncbi:MAG TPA: porin family protein [Chlorobaculum sp.]|uniref:Hemagglutinin-related protein n=1 Tax=Chlorobaculum tepidum (strain ATCC 49652 / DSM 12025 / NBRC 103806 / TLS) TaxID=194439 RepID=Q8KGA0_CHLTE|nr:hemagglutinin-related protein [Chlorobaculum tepidum TLS]HBU24326.1 porin family protein [Chlorobaculum sp.]
MSGTAWANGTEVPPPAPSTYTPPPPPPPVETPAPAPVVKQSNAGPYISGAVGLGLPEKLEVLGEGDEKVKMDSGIALAGALGYNFNPVRLEAEVGYHRHDISDDYEIDGHVSLLTVMANAYYDIDAGSGIKPYLMGGAGWGHTNVSVTDKSDDVFVWQVGAGVGAEVAHNTTLDLGYRYVKPNDFLVDNGGPKAKWAIHNIMLGLRYQF